MGIKRGLNPRLAEVGKIKIGGKGAEKTGAKGKYRVPVRFQHFVITTTERGKDGNFIPDLSLMEKINPKSEWKDGQKRSEPKEIPIVFLFDDIDMNFRTEFSYYAGAKCVCRGDGETAERVFTKAGKAEIVSPDGILSIQVKAGEKHRIPCDPDHCPLLQPDAKGATKCKPSGILSCLIPLSMNIGGVYRFRTHSWNTISNILAALDLIKTITGGILVGLPMKLQFLKKATTDHGNVSVVNVVFDGESQQKMRELAFIESKNRADFGINMLQIENNAKASGFMVNTDTAEDIEAEYFHEPETEEDAITDRADTALENVEADLPEDTEIESDDPIVLTDETKADKKEPEKKKEQKKEQKEEEPDNDGLELF